MIITDPIPWAQVPIGAQVLLHYGDAPRTVIFNEPIFPETPLGPRALFVEAAPIPQALGSDTVRMVILNEADAVTNLRAAGLTTEIIETKGQ